MLGFQEGDARASPSRRNDHQKNPIYFIKYDSGEPTKTIKKHPKMDGF